MSVVNRTSVCLLETVADQNYIDKHITLGFVPTHLRVSSMLYSETSVPTNPETLMTVKYLSLIHI